MRKIKFVFEADVNKEYYDLWNISYRSYGQHENLRKSIIKTWEDNANFKLLLSKCKEYLK